MTWTLETSCGFESAKIKYEVLPYLHNGGIDVGCGPLKVWQHLIGIDADPEVRPDIVLPQAGKLKMFADGAINNVFSSHLLEHIEDWQAALREWWRVLAIGGHLVLYLPHADLYPRCGEKGANPDHKHDFLPSDVVDFCTLAFPDWTLLENQERTAGNEYSFLLVLRKEAEGHGLAVRDLIGVKTAGLVRVGGNGDALWAASVAAHLHEQGYAVTVYCAFNGADILKHDPHIAGFKILPTSLLNDEQLLEFWAHEAPKYDKWVNLINSVEGRLLPHQSAHEFYLPQAVRHELMNVNYLDMVHKYAELPAGTPSRQRFYPSADEVALAKKLRAELPGPLVLISPTGSGPTKAWPHTQAFMEKLADAGIYTLMLGDLLHLPDLDIVTRHGTDYGHVVGQEWPLRLALAVALQADCVVATESVFANAVAFEQMPKVVMLSHSSNENLTRDWLNCIALEAPVACHPCHRIHNAAATLCGKDKANGKAACMSYYTADLVAGLVFRALGIDQRQAA